MTIYMVLQPANLLSNEGYRIAALDDRGITPVDTDKLPTLAVAEMAAELLHLADELTEENDQ